MIPIQSSTRSIEEKRPIAAGCGRAGCAGGWPHDGGCDAVMRSACWLLAA